MKTDKLGNVLSIARLTGGGRNGGLWDSLSENLSCSLRSDLRDSLRDNLRDSLQISMEVGLFDSLWVSLTSTQESPRCLLEYLGRFARVVYFVALVHCLCVEADLGRGKT